MKRLNKTSVRQTLLLAAAAASALLWLRLARDAGADGPRTLSLLMTGLTSLSAMASAVGAAFAGLLLAALAFVPVGFYLLGSPSIYAGIGLANLLLIALALAALPEPRKRSTT